MNRFYRDTIISSIVSIVLSWITQFPFPYRVVLLVPTCNGCTEPIQIHPLNFLIDFAFWLAISLSILSIIDWYFIRGDERRNRQASRIESSLGVSFAAGVVFVLGTLYGMEFAFGDINNLGWIIPVWIGVAAIAYYVISIKSLGASIKWTLLRLGRNSLVALLGGGFVFTLVVSPLYGTPLFSPYGSVFWAYFVLWSSVAFVVVCAFNIYYSRSERADKQSETFARSA